MPKLTAITDENGFDAVIAATAVDERKCTAGFERAAMLSSKSMSAGSLPFTSLMRSCLISFTVELMDCASDLFTDTCFGRWLAQMALALIGTAFVDMRHQEKHS
eukprot:TRINITY_DN3245_c0_g1_i2.p1 TRINITY_DN3245_c0_g1~~TRINITY_DN3245_c0_g1_i2.p1  ORF type:complete len:104 (-),score=21.97 TRINITY_DN3245_c0_g1_i2:33-344(-)